MISDKNQNLYDLAKIEKNIDKHKIKNKMLQNTIKDLEKAIQEKRKEYEKP